METIDASPFHQGEMTIQSRLGLRDKMERFGQKVIRDHMPRQHQEFYGRLPYVFLGHADEDGWPWASMLHGSQGFMYSSSPKHLSVQATPLRGDPLASNIKVGMPVGVLGIELHTRRRNRLAAHVTVSDQACFKLQIDQAFGNCPKYIHPREAIYPVSAAPTAPVVEAFTELDDSALALIGASDTFFVASYVAEETGRPSDGVDVSHRGGDAGFVRVDSSNLLTIPDYQGNNHFNTLGNFLQNPRAGLLFIDFDTGDLLMMTGKPSILWEVDELDQFPGAHRLWTFELDHGYRLKKAVPLRWLTV